MNVSTVFVSFLSILCASTVCVANVPVPKPASPYIVIPEGMTMAEPDESLPSTLRDLADAWEGTVGTGGAVYDVLLVVRSLRADGISATYFINGKVNNFEMKRVAEGIFAGTLPSGRYVSIRLFSKDRLGVDISGTKTEFTRVKR